MNAKQLGVVGEDIINTILINKEFIVLSKNKRIGRSEFDIIATKKERLYVFEVKTRSSYYYGAPEESVTTKKIVNFERCYQDLVDLYHFSNIVYVIATVVLNKQTLKCVVKFIKVY